MSLTNLMTGATQRTATITFRATGVPDRIVTVTQPAPTLSVSPASLNFTNTAGSQSFTITTNGYWTATSNQSWATISPASSIYETGTVTVTANTGSSSRTATITVKVPGVSDKTVTVTQDGTTTTPTLSVSPASLNFSSSSGSKSFTVTSNVANWSVSSNQSWATVTPASGGNNGTFAVNVAANTSTSRRTAAITVTQSIIRVANETVEQQMLKAWVSDGMLYVCGAAQGSMLHVYHITGVLIYQGVADGSETHGLQIRTGNFACGIYIVTDGMASVKVVN